MVGVDVGDRLRAASVLRESERRLQQFGEASQDVLWIRDADTMQWTYLTPAFETIYGLSRAEALRGDNFRNWIELIVPEDRDRAATCIDRVRDGEQVVFEYRIRRPRDGAVRWLRNTDFPILGDDGKIANFGGIGQDITAVKLTEERLRGDEQRLRLALDTARLATWDWDMTTNHVEWNDEHYRLEGYAVGEVEPGYETWIARVHPDDRAATEAALLAARDSRQPFVHEFRTLHPDGTVLWLAARGGFFYDGQGQPRRMIGAMQDVTERREWQERQAVLVAELQHRTRNLIGVIRSMADKLASSSPDLAEFQLRFRDRLEALARVQGLLSRLNEHDRVTFDELLRGELAAMNGEPERISLTGPSGVRLRSSTVQMLAMALHELATNAVKYGALGQGGARLAISWEREQAGDARPWLHIDWREEGVTSPPPDPHAGIGQGRELIERALPYQLGARTRFRLTGDGLHCTISVPVSAADGTAPEPAG